MPQDAGKLEDALWLIKTGDVGVGPVSTDEIVAMLESGELTGRTQVQRQGKPESWTRIDTTPLLAMARLEAAEAPEKKPEASADPNEHGWFVGSKFDPQGPLTRSEIRAMFKAARFNAQTLVWRDGMEIWQPLHPGHWLLAEPDTTPEKVAGWEARAQTVSTQGQEGWKPGFFTKALMVVGVLGGIVYFIGDRELKRVNSLTPDLRYAEQCRNPAMASAMASHFIKDRLNIVDTPKFELWSLDKLVKMTRSATNDCVFTVEDHFTFKNQFGGQSRGHARVVVAPLRADPNRWSLLSIDLR